MPSLAGMEPSLKHTCVVECPKSMVGRVIGKGGETIKALQQYTGAMIQIDQSCDPTRVTIAGSPEALQLARSMVTDIVNGHFKGFALLRQMTQRSALEPALPAPLYVEGYGFLPVSGHSPGVSEETLRAITAADLMARLSPTAGAAGLRTTAGGLADKMDEPLAGAHTSFTQSLTDPLLARLTANLTSAAAAGGAAAHGLPFHDTSLDSVESRYETASRLPTSYALPSPPTSPALSSPTSLPLGTLGWLHIPDPEGRFFYYNQITGQSQWHLPQ